MNRTPFCVNTWIFGNASLDTIVSRTARAGFDGIELVGEPATIDTAEVNRLCDAGGLRVCSICGMHPGPEEHDLRALCHPSPQERQRAVDYVRACVDLAAAVRARSVLVVPSLVGQPAVYTSRDEDIERATESLAAAGEHARESGILLTIEPINRYEVGLVNSIDDALAMAKAVNNEAVRIMGDTFHMQMEEPDGIPASIRRAGGYWLQHLHCADNTREAPGRGTMPWADIMAALGDIGFEGAVSCEPLPRGASPYDARRGSIPAQALDTALGEGLRHLRSCANPRGS